MSDSATLVIGFGSSAIADAIVEDLKADMSLTLMVDSSAAEAARLSADRLGYSNPLIEVDFSDLESVRHGFEQIDRPVGRVVYAHSYFALENRNSFSYADWHMSLAVNLTAVLASADFLRSRFTDSASFVVVTSTEAFRGSFRAASYSATKAAVHNLVMTLANNGGSQGIRFNAVAPGWIGGVMDTDEVFEMSKKVTPLGRLGTPEEVASVVKFLWSDDASFVNGSVIVVDGGYLGVDGIAKHEAESTPE